MILIFPVMPVQAEETEVLDKNLGPSPSSIQPGSGFDLPIGKDTSLHMIWIEPGSFIKGSPEWELGRDDKEMKYPVRLTRGYWLGETEVTQDQWQSVMGSNPGLFKGDPNLPVEQVSWEDCMEFCEKLTELERTAGRLGANMHYSLPTEAQWEYACRERGQAKGPFHFGAGLSSTQANFNGDYPYGDAAAGPALGETTPVKSYAPNALGLYDMHGNVWEWCLDWYSEYPSGGVHDPIGPQEGSRRVIRGGSWFSYARDCRSAYRNNNSPSHRYSILGFRLALQTN